MSAAGGKYIAAGGGGRFVPAGSLDIEGNSDDDDDDDEDKEKKKV